MRHVKRLLLLSLHLFRNFLKGNSTLQNLKDGRRHWNVRDDVLKKRKYLQCSDESDEELLKRVKGNMSHPIMMDHQMKYSRNMFLKELLF
jgi:hypothetical protein